MNILYNFLSNTKYFGQISPILTNIIENIDNNSSIHNNLILDKTTLSDIKLRYFLNYNDKTSDIGMILFQNCIDHIEKGTNRIIIQDKALNSMKYAIFDNPQEYLRKFIIKEDSRIANTYRPEPYYIQIFGSNEFFEEFLNSLQKDPTTNKAQKFWNIYKSNNYKPIITHKNIITGFE